MADIQTQLPVKLTDNTNTAAITAGSALKVDGSAVTQPVSGTVTANAGTGTFTVTGSGTAGSAASGVVTIQGIASMTAVKVDGSAVTQPVSGTVTANAGSGTFTVAGGGTAGSAATGVVTIQGIASMTAVKVDGSAVTQPVSFGEVTTGIVNSYSTQSSIANAAVGTCTYTVTVGKTLYLRQILASASGGPCKVVVDYGAGPTVLAVAFFSAAVPFVEITFAIPPAISASTAVNVKITNNAGSSQDVYATISGHEI